MMKIVFVIACLLSVNFGFCQNSSDSVKMVVESLFLAMKSGDSLMLTKCFSDSAILQTIAKSKEGKVSVRSEEVSAFARQIVKLPKGDADERVTYDLIKVDADLAIVWTPYRFYYKGSFSHCGVNSFQLVRINGQWKIQYLIDTRRKDNCI